MKSSFKVAFFVLVSCSVAVSELCRSAEVNSIKWRRHPDDCSTAYMCLLGQVVSYRCPEGYVIGTDEVTCVPAGSPLDDCKCFIIIIITLMMITYKVIITIIINNDTISIVVIDNIAIPDDDDDDDVRDNIDHDDHHN